MEEEKQLSGEESIKLITHMIYEAKGYFYESGMTALLYGFSFLICGVLTYLLEKHLISLPFQPFYLIVPVFFCAGMAAVQRRKKEKSENFY